jgi:hypothetical protein
MNYNLDLNRRPLNEVVCKHGSSKLFLSAIVISIICVALNLLYSIFTTVASFNTTIPFVDLSEYFDEEYYIILIATSLIAVVNSILSFIQYGYLYSAYSFFRGRSTNGNALKSFTKVFLAQLIITIVELPIITIGTIATMDDSYGIPGIKEAFIVIMAIVLIPIIAGVAVMSIFLYKGIKKSVDHAMAAYDNRNSGKLSIFVLVFTFIALAGVGINIMSTLINFAVMPNFGVYVVISNLVNLIVMVLTLVSMIMFIMLMFRFKDDMEIARQEWYIIEQQKAEIRAREYAAKQAQASNSFDNTQI